MDQEWWQTDVERRSYDHCRLTIIKGAGGNSSSSAGKLISIHPGREPAASQVCREYYYLQSGRLSIFGHPINPVIVSACAAG